MVSREDLLQLRNEIMQRPIGVILLAYLQDYISEMATTPLDAAEIKGMCKLVKQLKDIPTQVERKK